MKKLSLLTLAFCVFSFCHVLAFNPADTLVYNALARPNIIKVGLLSPFLQVGNISYERLLDKDISVAVTFFGGTLTDYQKTGSYGQIEYRHKRTTLGLAADLRIDIPLKDDKGRAFAGPFARGQRYNAIKIDVTDNSNHQTNLLRYPNVELYDVGFVCGYQRIFKNRVAVEFLGGPFYRRSSYIAKLYDDDTKAIWYGQGVRFRLGVNLGFKF